MDKDFTFFPLSTCAAVQNRMDMICGESYRKGWALVGGCRASPTGANFHVGRRL